MEFRNDSMQIRHWTSTGQSDSLSPLFVDALTIVEGVEQCNFGLPAVPLSKEGQLKFTKRYYSPVL